MYVCTVYVPFKSQNCFNTLNISLTVTSTASHGVLKSFLLESARIYCHIGTNSICIYLFIYY